MSLDMSARYTVDGYEGIAFYLRGYKVTWTEESEWTGEPDVDTDYVRAVMVGDDREYIVDVADLTLLAETDYCHSCGQVGCGCDVPDMIPGESPDPDWMNP